MVYREYSKPFLVLYPFDNILSIKYTLTVIMSTIIINVPDAKALIKLSEISESKHKTSFAYTQ